MPHFNGSLLCKYASTMRIYGIQQDTPSTQLADKGGPLITAFIYMSRLH